MTSQIVSIWREYTEEAKSSAFKVLASPKSPGEDMEKENQCQYPNKF